MFGVAFLPGCGSDDSGGSDDPGATTDALCANVRDNVFRGAQPVPPAQARRQLIGNEFVSSALCGRKLVAGTQIELGFDAAANGNPVVSWVAGCNQSGGDVTFAPGKLKISRISSTEIGCADGLAKQDGWLNGFFDSDPDWRLQGDRLTLASDDVVIEFIQKQR